jgi:hypothetical protein
LIKCTLEVFNFVVVSQLFLAVGLNELRVQVQLSLTFVTQPHVAQIRECCQRETQKMFKFSSEVMPSDVEKQLGNKRLRVQNYQIAAIISGQ